MTMIDDQVNNSKRTEGGRRMIQLYDRDAAVVTEVLRLVRAFLRDGGNGEAYNRLASWAPPEISEANPQGITPGRKRLLTDTRLTSIVNAIEEQSA
jgi:hypothetical protein